MSCQGVTQLGISRGSIFIGMELRMGLVEKRALRDRDLCHVAFNDAQCLQYRCHTEAGMYIIYPLVGLHYSCHIAEAKPVNLGDAYTVLEASKCYETLGVDIYYYITILY